jgi:hypothetical protein
MDNMTCEATDASDAFRTIRVHSNCPCSGHAWSRAVTTTRRYIRRRESATGPAALGGTALRTSTRIVWLTAAILAVYVGVIVHDGPIEGGETFPFFRWELFSRVPATQGSAYNVRLVEVNGKDLDPPVYFADAGAYISSSKAPEALNVMQELGRWTESDDSARAAYARSLFETRFFGELESVRYELVLQRYDILERLDCECFLAERTVATYSRS